MAGGDGQDQTTLQLLIDAIDFEINPADAVTTPRYGTNHFLGFIPPDPAGSRITAVGEWTGTGMVEQLEARTDTR